MNTMKNRARRCATPENVPPAAAAIAYGAAAELPTFLPGSPLDCTFGPSNLSLGEYMASPDFAPQSLEELREELEQGC